MEDKNYTHSKYKTSRDKDQIHNITAGQDKHSYKTAPTVQLIVQAM